MFQCARVCAHILGIYNSEGTVYESGVDKPKLSLPCADTHSFKWPAVISDQGGQALILHHLCTDKMSSMLFLFVSHACIWLHSVVKAMLF